MPEPRNLLGSVPPGRPVHIDFEGRPVPAYPGESVAVALFAAGITTLARSTKYHRRRGLFCLEGHCGSCSMRIGGRPNLRACMTPVSPGLSCERQNAFPTATLDMLAAADLLFRKGMDHHTMMTGSRFGNRLFLKLVRQMGGTGRLPDAPPAEIPVVREETADVCIVGGGPSGLAAAVAIRRARPGAEVVLFDEHDLPGGSLLAEPGGMIEAGKLVEAARRAGARVESSAAVIGFFPEDEGPGHGPSPDGIHAVVTPAGLLRLAARRTVYATGSYDQNLPFLDNDRPGIVSARACGRLAFRYGVRPGSRVAIVAACSYAGRLAAGLRDAGVEVDVIDTGIERVNRAHGVSRLRWLEVAGTNESGGYTRKVTADLVAVAVLPAPASELPRQHGAEVKFEAARGGFAVAVGTSYATSAPGVFACGDVAGYVGPSLAVERGAECGAAVAEDLP